MKLIVTNVCRLLLAVVFICSGYVKAIDPLGTQYKIGDYLEAMHLAGIVPPVVTLGVSVIMSAVEFCLGIFLLFAIRRRFASRCVLLFLLVMSRKQSVLPGLGSVMVKVSSKFPTTSQMLSSSYSWVSKL